MLAVYVTTIKKQAFGSAEVAVCRQVGGKGFVEQRQGRECVTRAIRSGLQANSDDLLVVLDRFANCKVAPFML
jgi:hypothetical protein